MRPHRACALTPEAAAERLDDLSAEAEPQSHPAGFAGRERLEQTAHDLGCDTGPVVLNIDPSLAVRLTYADSHSLLSVSALSCGLYAVTHQVHKKLVDLNPICHDRGLGLCVYTKLHILDPRLVHERTRHPARRFTEGQGSQLHVALGQKIPQPL